MKFFSPSPASWTFSSSAAGRFRENNKASIRGGLALGAGFFLAHLVGLLLRILGRTAGFVELGGLGGLLAAHGAVVRPGRGGLASGASREGEEGRRQGGRCEVLEQA